MAAAVSLSGSSITKNAGTHTVTKTATVGDLIVIVSLVTSITPPLPPPTDNNADGLGTYTYAVSAKSPPGSGQPVGTYNLMYVWVRDALIGNASSTIFTQTPPSDDHGGGLAVVRITGMANAGATAIVKTGAVNLIASSAPSVSWTGGGSANGSNPLLGAVINSTNPASMTKPTLFDTELLDTGYTTPRTGIEIVSDNTGNSSSVVSWGSSSASTFGALIVEFLGSAVTTTVVTATSATAAAAAGAPTPKEVVLATSATALAAAGVPGLVTPSNLSIVAEVAQATASAEIPTIVGTDPNITIAATVAVAHAAAGVIHTERFILNPEPDGTSLLLTPRLDTGLPNIFLLVDPEPAGYGGAYPSLTTYPGVILYPGIDIFGLDLIDGTLGTLLLTPAVDR